MAALSDYVKECITVLQLKTYTQDDQDAYIVSCHGSLITMRCNVSKIPDHSTPVPLLLLSIE